MRSGRKWEQTECIRSVADVTGNSGMLSVYRVLLSSNSKEVCAFGGVKKVCVCILQLFL